MTISARFLAVLVLFAATFGTLFGLLWWALDNDLTYFAIGWAYAAGYIVAALFGPKRGEI